MKAKQIIYEKDIIADLKKEVALCSFEGNCQCWDSGKPSFEDCINCSAITYINKKGIILK